MNQIQELQFLRSENARLKNSLTFLERQMIEARGEIDRLRLAERKLDYDRYFQHQLTDGAKP